jgi:hypothetical protein
MVLFGRRFFGPADEPAGLARVLESMNPVNGAGADKCSDDQADEKGIVDPVLLHDRYLREFNRHIGRSETISATENFLAFYILAAEQ